MSVEAFHANVIESSVTATTRTLVGVLGGVLSRLPAAEAGCASRTNARNTTQQVRLGLITGSPPSIGTLGGIRSVAGGGSKAPAEAPAGRAAAYVPAGCQRRR